MPCLALSRRGYLDTDLSGFSSTYKPSSSLLWKVVSKYGFGFAGWKMYRRGMEELQVRCRRLWVHDLFHSSALLNAFRKVSKEEQWLREA